MSAAQALAGALPNRWPDGSCRCCGFGVGRGHWYRCQHWQPPKKYRWLVEGQTYTYGPKVGKGDDARRGTLCQVVTLPRPGCIGNALVRWSDGHTAVVPSGVLRKPAPALALGRALAQAITEGEG